MKCSIAIIHYAFLTKDFQFFSMQRSLLASAVGLLKRRGGTHKRARLCI